MRPLLDTDKTEILEFARERKLNWIEDLSNKDDDFDWLRNDLLEKLEFDLEIGGVI